MRMCTIAVLLCLSVASKGVWGESVRAQADDLASLKSTDPVIRQRAFQRVVAAGSPSTDAARTALIELLDLETEYGRSADPDEPVDEEWAEYYAGVAAVVADMRDVRAIGALTKIINRGGLVTDALAVLGAPAIDAVRAQIDTPRVGVNTSVAITLRKMLSPENFSKVNDPVSLNKIRLALVQLESGPDPYGDFHDMVREIRGSLLERFTPGDTNGDRVVDCADVAVVRGAFGRRTGQWA